MTPRGRPVARSPSRGAASTTAQWPGTGKRCRATALGLTGSATRRGRSALRADALGVETLDDLRGLLEPDDHDRVRVHVDHLLDLGVEVRRLRVVDDRLDVALGEAGLYQVLLGVPSQAGAVRVVE